ncbi:MAG: hypothetical protein K1X74_07350 [Pirellulales bacterium]|nr:hypothetical protein [Pirellulales bacterium]
MSLAHSEDVLPLSAAAARPARVALQAPGDTLWVAALAAFLGAVAAIRQGTWQVAVESGQVLASFVSYPHDNSFYIYHVKAWSLINQVAALLLKAGASPESASLLLVALGGAIAFAGLALITLSLGGPPWLAVIAPLVCSSFTEAAKVLGATYPLPLIGGPHTYGTFSLSCVLLALGLLGCGRRKTGWFLLALAPAIHLTVGLWAVLVALLGTCCNWSSARKTVGEVWVAAMLGLLIATISYKWQATFWSDLPRVSDQIKSELLALSAEYLDAHRGIVAWGHPAVLLNLIVAFFGLLWLAIPALRLPAPARPLIAALVCSGLLAAVAAGLTAHQGELPSLFRRAMPGRYVNLVTLAFPAVAIGCAGANWQRLSVRALFVGIVYLTFLPLIAIGMPGTTKLLLALIGYALAASLLPETLVGALLTAAALVLALILGARESVGFVAAAVVPLAALPRLAARSSASPRGPGLLRFASIVLVLVAGLVSLMTHWSATRGAMAIDSALAAARQGSGLLLTGSDLFLVQLKTGRPVLLSGGSIDAIWYVPEAGADMYRVLHEVYGIDLARPLESRESMSIGSLYRDAGRELWQRRTAPEWQQLARKYGFQDIVVYKDWKLDLPLIADGDSYRLYRVPALASGDNP